MRIINANVMGRQEGIVQITGGVGNLSFYKTKEDGYLVRKKSGVSRRRIMNDPAYARTRENIAEFRRGAQATKLVRRAFISFIQSAADNRVTSRLTSVMMKIIKKDAVNCGGERRVTNDQVALLQGFEFNKHAALEKTFRAPFSASIDRASGAMVVDIPAFSPDLISAPAGATHFRLTALGAAIDFENGTYSTVKSKSSDIPVDGKTHEGLRLTETIAPGSSSPLFLVFGIEFLQTVNGVSHPLSDSAFNAMSMVRVDGSRETGVKTGYIEETVPLEERDTLPVSSVDRAEVSVPKTERILLSVARAYLLAEPLRRSRPAISERFVHGRFCRPSVPDEGISQASSHWQLADLGFQGHSPGGRMWYDGGGSKFVAYVKNSSLRMGVSRETWACVAHKSPACWRAKPKTCASGEGACAPGGRLARVTSE